MRRNIIYYPRVLRPWPWSSSFIINHSGHRNAQPVLFLRFFFHLAFCVRRNQNCSFSSRPSLVNSLFIDASAFVRAARQHFFVEAEWSGNQRANIKMPSTIAVCRKLQITSNISLATRRGSNVLLRIEFVMAIRQKLLIGERRAKVKAKLWFWGIRKLGL